jgi:hypothetical protein
MNAESTSTVWTGGMRGAVYLTFEVDLRELCAFLARHRERIWTAPVATIAQRVAEWRTSVVAAAGRPE